MELTFTNWLYLVMFVELLAIFCYGFVIHVHGFLKVRRMFQDDKEQTKHYLVVLNACCVQSVHSSKQEAMEALHIIQETLENDFKEIKNNMEFKVVECILATKKGKEHGKTIDY